MRCLRGRWQRRRAHKYRKQARYLGWIDAGMRQSANRAGVIRFNRTLGVNVDRGDKPSQRNQEYAAKREGKIRPAPRPRARPRSHEETQQYDATTERFRCVSANLVYRLPKDQLSKGQAYPGSP